MPYCPPYDVRMFRFTEDPVAVWEMQQQGTHMEGLTSEDQKTLSKEQRETLARSRGFNF
jgi:hypothetical protein